MDMNNMEVERREQQRELKQYIQREKEIEANIVKMKGWNTKMDENSLQSLGQRFPDVSNKKLFEDCQKGCIALLEESHQIFTNDYGDQKKDDCLTRNVMLCFVELFR